MQGNKRDFYNSMLERNEENIRYQKNLKSKNSNYKNVRYQNFRNKKQNSSSNFFIKSLFFLCLTYSIYLLARNDFSLYKSMLEKGKNILKENNISIEIFNEENKIDTNENNNIDENELKKMEEDSKLPKKN